MPNLKVFFSNLNGVRTGFADAKCVFYLIKQLRRKICYIYTCACVCLCVCITKIIDIYETLIL